MSTPSRVRPLRPLDNKHVLATELARYIYYATQELIHAPGRRTGHQQLAPAQQAQPRRLPGQVRPHTG